MTFDLRVWPLEQSKPPSFTPYTGDNTSPFWLFSLCNLKITSQVAMWSTVVIRRTNLKRWTFKCVSKGFVVNLVSSRCVWFVQSYTYADLRYVGVGLLKIWAWTTRDTNMLGNTVRCGLNGQQVALLLWHGAGEMTAEESHSRSAHTAWGDCAHAHAWHTNTRTHAKL